jgi:Ca2+-transporting ATPase
MNEKPWSLPAEQVLDNLNVISNRGLSTNEIKKRQEQYGLNRLKKAEKKSAWQVLVGQFKSLIIMLLTFASLLSFFLGEWVDGIAIAAAIVINAIIGFVTELKAIRSMEALQEMGGTTARVYRDNDLHEVSVEEIVPGDIVALESGDIVPADIRLFEASKLQCDESMLTGESIPVKKNIHEIEEDLPLAERVNMLFKGSAVTSGSAKGVVVRTGMDTELGQIATLVEEAEEETTPLEKKLEKLGHKLLIATFVITFIVGAAGIIAGKEIFLMIEMGIALAVAAIPEGLPIVATIALARGMLRMARRNALINRLSAVETLGSTNVICTDKTGTLTENKMTVTKLTFEAGNVTLDEEGKLTRKDNNVQENIICESLEIGMLCNNASYKEQQADEEEKAVGDPVEVALLVAATKKGMTRKELLQQMPEEREEAFDSVTMKMATYHQLNNGKYRVAVKGAPDAVLEVCTHFRTSDGDRDMSAEERDRWLERNNQLAEEGLRVLALAAKETDSVESSPYEGLTFVGLVGFSDPPRKDVRTSIASCHKAGIRVIMVTGDQPVTARNVGIAVGLVSQEKVEAVHGRELKEPDSLNQEEQKRLLGIPIFARVSPRQKLNLIALHQNNGSVVAMTGDGVNDAPALKKADIGVAMGKRGTQVASQASDVILKDDAFSSIVVAIELGRIIFGNIRKFVIYLLSGNVSEVLIVSLALLFNAPLPIHPLQILYLNMLSDVITALAIGLGKGEPSVMLQKPRDQNEPILTYYHWTAVGSYSLLITAAVLGAFAIALRHMGLEGNDAITISFLTLAFARQWHVFNMRDRGSRFFKNDVVENPFIWGALIICSALLLIAVYVPGLAAVLKLTHPGISGWYLILGFSLIPFVVGQIVKLKK